MSRKLANSWAQGTWGKEFEAVYVLPVRALQQSQYDNASVRRDETLATAIANNCFATQNKEEAYKRLRHQISQELDKPTTLVVLDGLDERYGASEKLLNQAKAGKHKLLMLSRPYGIEAERPLVDIEIEHTGFSDGQMQAFITDELSPALGQELLAFIRKQPAIGKIAHVPVNLQILCALWQDDGGGVRAATMRGSLPGLYRMLTEYVWQRYKDKHKEMNLQDEDREALYSTLGKIAVRGLEAGELLLSQGLVEGVLDELGAGCRVREMLKDAGFLLLQDLGKQYQFPHLTFQEYFAGRWLARQFLSGEAHEQARVKRFFSKHRYQGQYAVTLSFMAGEVVKKQEFEGMKQLLELIEAYPREVVGVQHVLLQVRLLHEWLCVGGDDLQEELVELEETFHTIQSLKEWVREGLLEEAKLGAERWHADNLLSLLIPCLRTVAVHAPFLLEPVISACKDEDVDVRKATLNSLGRVVVAVPGEAPSVLELLINACKDEDVDVRKATLNSLGRVVVAVPGEAPSVLEPLINACKDENRKVRRAALNSLGQVVAALPGEAPSVRDALINACKDENVYVRLTALKSLVQVVEAAPGFAPYVRKALINACKDEDAFVRRAALESLVQVVEAVPGFAPSVRELLINACKDENVYVRLTALESLGRVVAAVPGEAPSVREPPINACKDKAVEFRLTGLKSLAQVARQGGPPFVREALINACKDESVRVRKVALKSLGQVVVAVPGFAPFVREPLINASKDEDVSVRLSALESLVQVGAVVPGEAPYVREPLINACKDEDVNVRNAAVKSLGRVGAVVPGEAPYVRETLINACKDEWAYVRHNALECLGQVVAAVPGEAPSVREPLSNGCKDEDAYVRNAAVKSLGQMVAAVPGETPCVIECLIKALKDVDVRFCGAALEQFSVQQLMEAYWIEQNEGFIPFIVGRLYHMPLVVLKSTNPQQQRLVLYTTARQAVGWDKPREEVQCFVRQIQACLAKRTRSDL